jgi:hypothetical protein
MGVIAACAILLLTVLWIPGELVNPEWQEKVEVDYAVRGQKTETETAKYLIPPPALWQLLREPAPPLNIELYTCPERYLQATGEMFIVMLLVCWCTTVTYNPEVFEDNILRSIVGYNNLCVGFDTPPARYVAAPLQVLTAIFAMAFARQSNIRLQGWKDELPAWKYWFVYIVQWMFGFFLVCFPALLVITPSYDDWGMTMKHLSIFMGALIICWSTITANLIETAHLKPRSTWIWYGCFTFCTVGLAVVGILDVRGFHALYPENKALSEGQEPKPAVNWRICAYLDFGWFVLLGLTVVFLPDSPPLAVVYHCENEKEDVEDLPLTSARENSSDWSSSDHLESLS